MKTALKSICCNSDLVNFNSEYYQCFVCDKLHKKHKMKTAIQTLIDMIDNGIHNKNELIKTFGDLGGDIGNGIKYLKQVRYLCETELREKEKRDIVEAYNVASNGGYDFSATGEQYFEQTFKKD